MKDTFDIRKYLVENKLTENSRGTFGRRRFANLEEDLELKVNKLYSKDLEESGDRQFIDAETGKEIKEGYDHHDPEWEDEFEDDVERANALDELGYTGDDFEEEDFTDPDDLDAIGTPKDDFKDDIPADEEDDASDEEPEVEADTNSAEIESFCNEIESKYPGDIEWIDLDRLHMLLKGRHDTIDKSRANRFWDKAIKACWDYFKEYDYPSVLAVDFKYSKGEEEDEENNGYIFKRILPHPLCKVYRPEGLKPEYDDEGNLIS